ncbi:MAG: DNA topoisomerase VI subunit B [Deltaproteobacteria bacterium]|nr:MAG: DNA topoisomerase VI subunit B [Deltaproteobacteria bacterium]
MRSPAAKQASLFEDDGSASRTSQRPAAKRSAASAARAAAPRGRGTGHTTGQGKAKRRGQTGADRGASEPARKEAGASAKASSGGARSGKASAKAKPAGARSRRSGARRTGTKRGRSAAEMASRQREISVSEFFTKNRHLLGFDSPSRALLTAVKEAVDNSLDACEEAAILPDLEVEITEISERRYRIAVEDNGPGIVRTQVPRIFGKLLYGSKFHRLKQSRGQQGIGISAAGMYGQLTTGRPVVIRSRTSPRRPAHHFELVLDTAKNAPKILRDEEFEWEGRAHGTRVEIELEGTYRRGRQSVDEYIALTHMANPHCRIRYKAPKDDWVEFPRASTEPPEDPAEIRPHPYGVELGTLMKMLHATKARNLSSALQQDFSRVSPKVAKEICQRAGVRPTMRPSTVRPADAEKIHRAIQETKILAPPTSCLSPIGEEAMLAGLKAGLAAQGLDAEFFHAVTRRPAIYRGNPFQVEVAIAWGGNLGADDLAQVYRFANRVPLLYQASACAITKAVISAGWRNYGVQQARGALPTGPLAIFAHVASVWVPFTSEAKEAIASYDEILKELRLALQECGRHLGRHIRRRKRLADEERKRSHIETFIPIIGEALQEILSLSDTERDRTVEELTGILHRSRKDL